MLFVRPWFLSTGTDSSSINQEWTTKPKSLKSMSEAAKERVIALGAQFNSIEHEVASLEDSSLTPTFEMGSPKKSFWKRNTSKLPGR